MTDLARRFGKASALVAFLVANASSVVAGTESAGSAEPVDPSAAVVKVYVAAVESFVWTPWRPGFSTNRTGSGVVIGDGRILTNAHVVSGHTYVQVTPNGSPVGYTATVAFVSHVADLALLTVDDPDFSDEVEAMPLGELPRVRDQVAAYGFPNGGDTLSITAGVVSRVEHEQYAHGRESLLAIQMDAAIAPGSSGGPVVGEKALVGIAMQTFGDSSIGSAVPVPLVRQFLEDVVDGRCDGVPDLGIRTQTLSNDALRSSLGVPAGESGVLLIGWRHGAPVEGVLQPGDVLLGIEGVDVADDGTVEFRRRERTSLRHVVDKRQVGDEVTLRYLRHSRVREGRVRLTMSRGEGALVPRLYDRAAEYYVFGGLTFVALSMEFVDEVRSMQNGALGSEIPARLTRERGAADQEVIYLAEVLTGDVNLGYGGLDYAVLETVGREPVRNLAHLARLVEDCEGPFVTFGFGQGRRVTLALEDARRETPELVARYGLTSDRSAGVAREIEARRDAAAAAAETGLDDPEPADPEPGDPIVPTAATSSGEGAR